MSLVEAMNLSMESPPEAKKLRVGDDFSEVDGPSTIGEDSPETGGAQDSPAGPSSARSSNGSAPPPEDEFNLFQNGNLFDLLSKNIFGGLKMEQFAPMLLPDGSLLSSACNTPSLAQPPAPVVPGAVALANMPTAKLFSKDDWSWHRNPAASIRSGGTNKQTPVWKYFVYDKTDNLSRCIVGDCTYQLKGPHTSTLACHLKKHTAEYAEFSKLKNEYSRERAVSQMPPSPASSTSGSSCTTTAAVAAAAAAAGATKLNEAMLLAHNNNNEMQQHKEQLQQQQIDQMHHQLAVAAAHAAAANARPKSNGSMAHRLTPPPSSQQQHQQQQQQQNAAAAQAAAMMAPFSYLLQNPGGMVLQEQQQSISIFTAAAAAANPLFAQSLLQQGIAMGPNRELQFSKKWRRDEKKQRDMEHRLTLFISSARLPSSIVNDAAFRDLLETAQPRFACPTDASQIDQVLTAQQGRLQVALRQAMHLVRRMCVMVDCIAVGEKSFRLAVSACIPAPSGTRDQLLLALKPIELEEGQEQPGSNVVESIIMQVLADNGLTSDKIIRVMTSGVERDERTTIGGVPRLIAYRSRLLAVFMRIIDSNAQVQELKKRFCELVVTLISQEGLMSALMSKTGGPVHLPFNESFVAILEAVFLLRDKLTEVFAEAGMAMLSQEDWKLSELLLALLSCLVNRTSKADSIDTVLPSLMQILGILQENEEISHGIADELRSEIENLCGSITSPDESVMESDFLVATALNPERILLLNEEQIAYAKRELERRVQDRMARQEEAASRKRPFSCLDQLLHKVTNIQHDDSSSSIYPSYGSSVKKEPAERNRFAEAIVQAYFDEVTQSDSFSSAPSFSNRHLPPAAFWHHNTHRCPQLAEIALELLSIPASTPGVEGLFGVKVSSFDPTTLQQLPERLERDTLLRFNRALIPK